MREWSARERRLLENGNNVAANKRRPVGVALLRIRSGEAEVALKMNHLEANVKSVFSLMLRIELNRRW